MDIWCYLVALAVVQGIAEFLPISSSGHLAVLGTLFGFSETENLRVGIVLHAGSLLAITAFYWKTLLGFLKPDRWKLAGMVILATIPAGAAGMALHKSGVMEKVFGDMAVIGFAFLITATLLRLTEKEKLIAKAGEPKDLDNLTWKQALLVGISQMVAITPGLSRSGTTISTGILCGIKRDAAGTFSFLMAIPVIGGAVLLDTLKMIKGEGESSMTVSIWQLLTGLAVSAVVSYVALTFLTRLIKRGKLSVFSYYLYALGGAVLLWQLYQLIKG